MSRTESQMLCEARFEFPALWAQSAFLVGEFNNWDVQATPMQRGDDGVWRVQLVLPRGLYRYKFMVDGIWRCSPDAPSDRCDRGCEGCPRCVPNEFGSFDRVAVVA